MKRIIIASAIFLSACSTADYTPAPQLEPVEAGRIVAAATATEDAARITATFVAWAPGATATSLANDRSALALTPTAASVALQMTAEADSAMLTAQARHDNATVQAALSNATMQALTPTPTPYPTPTNTPDAYATQRAVMIADAQGYGGVAFLALLGLAVIGGVAFVLGAFANRIEGETKARQIEAQGKADAERTRAEGDAYARRMEARANYEASHIRTVQAGAYVVSNVAGGVQIAAVGGVSQEQPQPEIAPLEPIRRMTGGKSIEPLSRLSDIERQAVEYLEHSAGIVGGDNAMLPTAAQTNNSALRQEAVKALKAAGFVVGKDGNGGGLHVKGYRSINDLKTALSFGQVHLT